ncbi:MAG: LicD family protein, partial [Phocaeicola sp.]
RSIWAVLNSIYPKGTYLSNTIHNNGYGIVHKIDSIYPLSTIEFEGKLFSAPKNVAAYLTELYKNYMEIPPVDKRQIHVIYPHSELIKKS